MAVYCNGHHMTDSYYTYYFAEIAKRIWWSKSAIKQINGSLWELFCQNQKCQFFDKTVAKHWYVANGHKRNCVARCPKFSQMIIMKGTRTLELQIQIVSSLFQISRTFDKQPVISWGLPVFFRTLQRCLVILRFKYMPQFTPPKKDSLLRDNNKKKGDQSACISLSGSRSISHTFKMPDNQRITEAMQPKQPFDTTSSIPS